MKNRKNKNYVKRKNNINKTQNKHHKKTHVELKLSREPRPQPHSDVLENMRMTSSILKKIQNTIGKHPVETGGMLLGDPETYEIHDFIFDNSAETSGASYQPNTKFLNKILESHPSEFLGIIHSHPFGYRQLSPQDLRAAWSNLTSPGNPHLKAYLMPIVQLDPTYSEGFELIPYIVTCDPKGCGNVIVHNTQLKIIGETQCIAI